MPLATKRARVVTYHDELPSKKSQDHLRLRYKLNTFISTTTTTVAINLGQVLSFVFFCKSKQKQAVF